MPTAKVSSVDAIRHFRVAMIKFFESTNSAIGNADSDVQRAETWIRGEAKTYWEGAVRKAQAALAEAAEKVRMKTLYKNFDGTTPSAVDEKKAWVRAKQRLEFCEQKMQAVRRFAALMEREAIMYKGTMQRFSTTIQSGVPAAIVLLDRVVDSIDRYMQANPERAAAIGATAAIDEMATAGGSEAGNMNREEPTDEPGKAASKEATETFKAESPKPEIIAASTANTEQPA